MFLDNFKQHIIYRGLEYFNDERVKKIDFTDINIISGIVEGSDDYFVTIDVESPYNSSCSCPYDGPCKHMAALYFEAFPAMSEDYIDNDYEEEYDWYEENDEDDYYDDSYFIVPTNYDALLNKYLQSLSFEETRKLLKDILNCDRENTYEKYLKPLYDGSADRIQMILDGINRRALKIVNNSFGSRFDDYSVSLIEDSDRDFLKSETDIRVTDYLNKILHDCRLYCFEDKLFLCELIKEKFSDKQIQTVADELRSYLIDLKNMGVTSLPKSNVLIALYELESKYDINKLSVDFINNLRYDEFTTYVIKNYKEIDALYEKFKKTDNEYKIRKDISSIFRKFYEQTGNKEADELSHYYGYVYNLNLIDLDKIVEYDDFYEKYYNRILKEGNSFVKIQLYAKLQMKKELYEYLLSRNDYNNLRFFASFLDEYYHNQLLNIFKEKTYEELKSAQNRKDYVKAATYVRAIQDLKEGRVLAEDFIAELKNDERFRKRSALFDEIRKGQKK